MPHIDIGGSVIGKLYLGFDAGTQSVKVAVYDEQFRLVTSRVTATSLTITARVVEMDVNTYLDNCRGFCTWLKPRVSCGVWGSILKTSVPLWVTASSAALSGSMRTRIR